jgi:hypothetical protein
MWRCFVIVPFLQNGVQKLRLRWAILEWRRCYALNRDPPESGAQAQPRSVRKYEWRWGLCRPVFHIVAQTCRCRAESFSGSLRWIGSTGRELPEPSRFSPENMRVALLQTYCPSFTILLHRARLAPG